MWTSCNLEAPARQFAPTAAGGLTLPATPRHQLAFNEEMIMNSTKTLSTMGAALLAAYLSVLGAPAQAADVNDRMPRSAVSFADLNIGSPQGIATLYSRLTDAARSVCGDMNGSRLLVEVLGRESCQKEALQRAVLKANMPALTNLYAQKSGHTPGPEMLTQRR
jgi:UrcA family protein